MACRNQGSAHVAASMRTVPWRISAALIGALVFGVVLSFGQTWAPGAVAPLFNSAAPVVALAAAVALAARRLRSHVLLGAVAGPLAVVGYYTTALARGFGVNMSFVVLWCAAGIIAGAAMGTSVWLLRGHGPEPMRALGAAVFPAVALGEAAHGLVRISETTPVAYWWALAVVGVGVLVWLISTRLAGLRSALLACAATIAAAALLFAVYGLV